MGLKIGAKESFQSFARLVFKFFYGRVGVDVGSNFFIF